MRKVDGPSGFAGRDVESRQFVDRDHRREDRTPGRRGVRPRPRHPRLMPTATRTSTAPATPIPMQTSAPASGHRDPLPQLVHGVVRQLDRVRRRLELRGQLGLVRQLAPSLGIRPDRRRVARSATAPRSPGPTVRATSAGRTPRAAVASATPEPHRDWAAGRVRRGRRPPASRRPPRNCRRSARVPAGQRKPTGRPPARRPHRRAAAKRPEGGRKLHAEQRLDRGVTVSGQLVGHRGTLDGLTRSFVTNSGAGLRM